MNSRQLAPVLLLIPFAFTTLACPTRPIDRAGSGGEGGEAGAPTETGGHAGAAAGTSGAAGSGAGGAAGTDVAGTGGGTAGAAGAAAGAAGGVAGAAGGTPGDAGGAAGSTAGAAGGATGGASGATGGAGGTTGLGGAAGMSGLPDGQACSLAANCASGVCTAFYVDVDGDGYGTGQAVGFCGTTAPIGYASQNGDCCDNATNLAVAKLIHPGATFQNTSAGGVCGITWDYDCSGAIEQQVPTAVSCGPYPDCVSMTGFFPDSDCGQTITSMVCRPNASSGTCDLGTGLSGPQLCK